MQNIIAFTRVAAPFGWLGCMSPHTIRASDETWRTAEALFQAMRFDSAKIQEEIRSQTSPMAAKLIAKRHQLKMVVEPRSAEDLDNMVTVLKLKLQQHRLLRRQLLETNGAILIEDCSKRAGKSGLFWGAALKNGEWVGENHLGRLWMGLRVELRASLAMNVLR